MVYQVLLGLPYDGAIDIWSLGCISVELFLGLPIFPGVSDHNQICRIVEMTGSLPDFMLENGKDTLKFFKKVAYALFTEILVKGALPVLKLPLTGGRGPLSSPIVAKVNVEPTCDVVWCFVLGLFPEE